MDERTNSPAALAAIALQRAAAAIEVGRPQRALDELAHAISLDPRNSHALVLRARALVLLERYAEALDAADAALRVEPNHEWALQLRSIALRMLGQRGAEALAAADEAVRVAPDVAATYVCRALALAQLGRGPEARAAIATAVELAPDDAGTRRTAGSLWSTTDYHQSEAHFRAALRLDPTDATALNNLGTVLEKLGRHAEADAAYRAALLANPTLAVARRNLYRRLQQRFRFGAPTGLAAIFLALRVAMPTSPSDAFVWLFGVVISVAVLALPISAWLYRRSRLRRLQRDDPQLFELYTRLRADRRAGRL